MTQVGLFDAPPRAPRKTEQAVQLERVTSGIGHLVLRFFVDHVGKEFRAGDLRAYVEKHAPAAPGSPDRIMRALKASGRVRYTLLDRAGSLYRCDGVRP